MTGFVLSEKDKRLVDEFVEAVGLSRQNEPKKTKKANIAPTTAFYVGRTLDRKPIPRRRGDKPGKARVGLFKFIETSEGWEIESVLRPNGEHVQVDVLNLDTKPLEWDFYELQKLKYGRWAVTCCQ